MEIRTTKLRWHCSKICSRLVRFHHLKTIFIYLKSLAYYNSHYRATVAWGLLSSSRLAHRGLGMLFGVEPDSSGTSPAWPRPGSGQSRKDPWRPQHLLRQGWFRRRRQPRHLAVVRRETFLSVVMSLSKWARVFVLGKLIQPCLMFVRNVKACPSRVLERWTTLWLRF